MRRATSDHGHDVGDNAFARQEANCRAFTVCLGYEVGFVLEDVGAGTLRGNLLQRETLFNLVAQREVGAVVVSSLDRLTRNAEYLEQLQHEFDDAGVRLYTYDASGDDSMSPAARRQRALYEFVGARRRR